MEPFARLDRVYWTFIAEAIRTSTLVCRASLQRLSFFVLFSDQITKKCSRHALWIAPSINPVGASDS
ncbi:hypothetical protein I7I53_00934 [Histoplasma capsulatum var. duboisii H88]|uniref:Uncharacterized protein n=1 Tax=Ajellomyces capsulatus (strain H88) TaxID=544711 RepID=A0A8A1LMF4_AJEC8|nr:hypothetical protein I7I53_00934 [Histoplasma capsulatum var. duboisii H88]